jgi:hypothetical protein
MQRVLLQKPSLVAKYNKFGCKKRGSGLLALQNATAPLTALTGSAMVWRPDGQDCMRLTVSKKSNWDSKPFVKVPVRLLFCQQLHANSKLLLIFLINQVGYKPVSVSTMDRCLGIHRSTRIRCMAELRELGFISGHESHLVLMDPEPILNSLYKNHQETEEEFQGLVAQSYLEGGGHYDLEPQTPAKRDYLQEATDSWNRYRPKDYQKIRRISGQLVKALDYHMRELRIQPHHYDEFFSALKTGIEKSDFWSTNNSSKTLQSIIGIGNPTDKKKNNVYTLFNDGIEAPAAPIEEGRRNDTIVYPAAYRKLINEYETAQHAYQQAYQNKRINDDVNGYVIRTEQALKDVKLDPTLFRFKYGLRTWPTETPEPKESRIVNWTFDDEYGYAY